MSLILTVLTYRQQPMSRPLSERFESAAITLGRAPDVDWTLPDPDQLISKRHCTIRLQGGRYTLTDTSTNGVFVNGSPQAVGHGQSLALADGDRLGIGSYEILVKIEDAAREEPFAAAPAARPAPASVLPSGPLDDPFGLQGFAAPPLAPAAAASPEAGFAPPFTGPDSDPFAAAAAVQAAPAPGAPLIPEGPDWLLSPGPSAAELAADQYAQPDHLGAEHAQYQPPRVVPGTLPENWDQILDPSAPPAPPLRPAPVAAAPMPRPASAPMVPPVSPDPTEAPFPAPPFAPAIPPHAVQPSEPPRAATVVPMRPTAAEPPLPPGAPAAPRPGAPAAAAGPDGAALLAAFLAAAGIDPAALRDADPGETMATLGRLFRELAVGLRDALATRAMIKTEYRVEQTMIRATNNNPLKFSVDAEQMLTALLSRARPGYLPGVEAVQEGFKDIRAHELALLGGMQAAVAALLKQFDPEQLKQRLERHSLIENLLPAARKAKYWEMYEQHYKQIAADVSEDVRGTFGRAFASAYEEQARKL